MLMLALLVIAACATPDDNGTTQPNPGPTDPSSTTSTSQPTGSPPAAVVEAAFDDLADRLDVDTRRIRLISSELVTWPDGSLGCPSPCESYTQALVEGYRVVLNHEERAFDYHGANDEAPFLCPTEEKDGGYEFIPPPGFDD